MEAKKNPQLDIYRKSTLFFNIGLFLSISLVYGIFQIEFKGDEGIMDLGTVSTEKNEILDIPLTLQPPPPPPKIQLAEIVEVANEEVIIENLPIIDMEMQENAEIEEVAYQEIELDAPEEEKAEEIFSVVEVQAEPVGGVKAFYAYVAQRLAGNYPPTAERMNIQGVVYIQFVVEKDGSITDVKAMKGIGGGCDELAIKVVEESPKWIPGKQRGRAVRSYKMVPIRFILKIRN